MSPKTQVEPDWLEHWTEQEFSVTAPILRPNGYMPANQCFLNNIVKENSIIINRRDALTVTPHSPYIGSWRFFIPQKAYMGLKIQL
jgi:hypothetical protein